MTTHGTYDQQAGALRFERRYAQPIEAVWRAVTSREERRFWFPADRDIEPTEFDPPLLFEFMWGEDRLRFELEADGGGTRLVFTHFVTRRDQGAMFAAGWHMCLDRLDERVAGGEPELVAGEITPEWETRYAEYQERGVPAGADVPGR